MGARSILGVSLGLNLVLATALAVWHWLPAPAAPPVPPPVKPAVQAPPAAGTRILVRKQFFSWSEIETNDYAAYIANLRDIDCPESTVRDIIVAEINQLYARRRAAEVPSTSRQWWRSEPDPEVVQSAMDRLKALDAERTALLTKLLGPGWETDLPEYQMAEVDLRGPYLDDLTPESRQAVEQIVNASQSREETYLRERQKAGLGADPKEMARLQQQTRNELAQILNPTQMEEYLLRYSSTAERLRRDLRGFEPSADEFRQIFRNLDPVDLQIQSNYAGDDAATRRKREELQAQCDATIKQALGNERFQLYQLTRDPAFNQAREVAEQFGASAEAVLPVYQVNQLALAQQQRIQNDRSLTQEDRARALQQVQEEQQKSIQVILAAKGASRRPNESPAAFPPIPP